MTTMCAFLHTMLHCKFSSPEFKDYDEGSLLKSALDHLAARPFSV